MERPLSVIDENATSLRLRQQIDAINECISSEKVAKTLKENVEIETDISLNCSQSGTSSVSIELAEEEFWRLVAEAYTKKIDEMRHKNLKLEEEIKQAEIRKVNLEKARDELLAVVEDAISGDGPEH